MAQTGENRRDWVLVVLLTIAGSLLRIAYALQVPPFLDEYSSILAGMSILRTGGIPELPSGVLYPSGSLFSYLEAAVIGVFGFSDIVARLPSLLVSAITLPLLYVLARRMLNRRVALLSVALLAMHPEAVVWGGRARMYALLQLLVLLTLYSIYRSVVQAPPDRDGQPAPAWPWVLCFVAATFAQDEAILLLPILWFAALIVQGPRWFLRPTEVLLQVLVPAAAVGIRYWLNDIRVPGEVYTLTHDAFFRFPPAVAHGVEKIAPFLVDPWAWPISLLFLIALVFLIRGVFSAGAKDRASRIAAPAFLAYVVLALASAIVLVVNTPWQDDRYLFMVLPAFLLVGSWGLDQIAELLSRRWPSLRMAGATTVLVIVVAGVALPAGLSALCRFEPDYSAAYRWLATQLRDEDLVATMRPAPAAAYLGRAHFLVAEDKHQEFIMRLNGEWVDRWAGARVLESPDAFREQALQSGHRVWFVIDEARLESPAYSPEFVALVLQQMELVWRDGGVLVFQGLGYQPPPEMTVSQPLDVNFADQLLLKSYAMSTDWPEPGEVVTLRLQWQAKRPERDYTVFVHVVGTDGQGLTQIDGEPLLGLYSMSTLWPRDRIVTDERRLTLPDQTPPGRYRLEVGLYDANEVGAGPLAILDPSGNAAGHSVTLDFLHVDVPPAAEPLRLIEEGTLGDVVRLVGYDLSQPGPVTAGSALALTLTWECLTPMGQDYTVFVHLAGADGQPLAQTDSQPLNGTYPTSYWDEGERLADPYLLNVPSSVPPGEYQLVTGMYLLATRERLPTADGEDAIHLASLSVEAR